MKTSNRIAALSFTLLATLIAVSACTQTPIPPTPTLTPDPSTATQTVNPTSTLVPSQTATIAPTSTATNTITPTFDLAPPATITLQSQAACPPVDSSLALDTSSFEQLHEIYPEAGDESGIYYESDIPYEELDKGFEQIEAAIADFLSRGGHSSALQDLFNQQEAQLNPNYYGEVLVAEVTGDNLPEVFIWVALPLEEHALASPMAVSNSNSFFSAVIQQSRLYIFSCQEDMYVTIGTFEGVSHPPGELKLPSILDLNADGINEIIQPSYVFAGSGFYSYLRIFTWNGSQFIAQIAEIPLVESAFYFWDYSGIINQTVGIKGGQFEFMDIDKNGTLEIVFSGIESGSIRCQVLYRQTRIVLRWNGDTYSSFFWWTPSPIYRAQAVWDADHMASRGFYKDALALYEMAVYDDSLRTWSFEYNDLINPLCDNLPDSDEVPIDPQLDEEEAVRLSAYSLYRTMLVFASMEANAQAQSIYDQLVADYQYSSAAIYTQLASTFWKEYSNSSNLTTACDAAIQFAADNLEVLSIGNVPNLLWNSSNDSEELRDYPWPAPFYEPQDICPFSSQ